MLTNILFYLQNMEYKLNNIITVQSGYRIKY